ncbi:MAG: hypothetical protein IIB44_06545 [Candidatus Marinimicrobia bacterium]|nr:hypothetical protein [Candidatus Neomarinimicrobiota bacterium]MCH8069727.1 hypothetical protein [Candidatus Neomarinimicrobiota bacterium]
MNKLNKRQKILIGVIGILIIYAVMDRGLLTTGKEIAKGIKAGIQDEILSVSDTEKDVFLAYLNPIPELNWSGSWNSDPFFYVSVDIIEGSSKEGIIDEIFGRSGGDKARGFSLTGISWHGNAGYALINESIVKEGDAIGGFKVDKIASNYVILKQGAQAIRLSINE